MKTLHICEGASVKLGIRKPVRLIKCPFSSQNEVDIPLSAECISDDNGTSETSIKAAREWLPRMLEMLRIPERMGRCLAVGNREEFKETFMKDDGKLTHVPED